MSQDDRNDAPSQPILVGLEETPELAECWRALFGAAWDAYETLMQRRRAAATPGDNRINDQDAETQRA